MSESPARAPIFKSAFCLFDVVETRNGLDVYYRFGVVEQMLFLEGREQIRSSRIEYGLAVILPEEGAGFLTICGRVRPLAVIPTV